MLYTTTIPSPLGRLKLQCTDERINAIEFIDEHLILPQQSHPLLERCITQLNEYFLGTRIDFELPLQQAGTAFQQKVWDLLLAIPFGKTISYNRLATQYGDLKAIRAVASANGKNKLAIIVPCHRVIGSNQSLTGYAGGLWRKKWLLEHEAKHHVGVEQMGLSFGES
jgi:methylated-DNA-[protein]-cysteine S-methyltransferase